MTDRIISIYGSLADVPFDFTGIAKVENVNYEILIRAQSINGVITRKSDGSSDDIAYRPSASILGKGSWKIGGIVYESDGNSYSQSKKQKYPTLVWDIARAKASSGFGNAILAYIGDSTSAGPGALNGVDYVGALPYIAASRLSGLMVANGVPVSSGSSFGMHGFGNISILLGYDSRIALGASWNRLPAGRGLGGDAIYSTGATLDSYTFTPTAAFDTIDVYYKTNPTGYSTFTIDVDGGAPLATVNTLGAEGIFKVSVSVPIGTHVVHINKTIAGLIVIIGISTYKNNSEVQVLNLGESGMSAANYLTSTITNAPENCFAVLQPHLSLINLTINDTGGNVNTYKVNLQNIIDMCKLYGDVVLMTPNPISGISQAELYNQAVREIASINSLNVIDLSREMGENWSILNTSGLMMDTVHPKQAGYKMIADIVGGSGIFY